MTAIGLIPFGKLKVLGPIAEGIYDGARVACSFSGDTKVLMADGTTKAIKDIKVGDKVLATDPETGEQGPRKVTHLLVHQDQLVGLELVGGAVLMTTEDHPFWNDTDKQWQQAQNLDTGERLHTSNGELVAVAGLNWARAYTATAYTLTVDDIHTYYVIAGNTPVLVHNYNRGPSDPIGLGSGYTGRLDRFPMGQGTDFEIHVYYRGSEVGIFGSNGWFDKHGKTVDVPVPDDVYNRLKGKAVEEMRASGRLGTQGTQDITGDKWKMPRLQGGC